MYASNFRHRNVPSLSRALWSFCALECMHPSRERSGFSRPGVQPRSHLWYTGTTMRNRSGTPQVNYDAIQTALWADHADSLRELLDRQNRELCVVARDRDRILGPLADREFHRDLP